MVRVSSPAKLRPWSELTAKMVMGVVPGLVKIKKKRTPKPKNRTNSAKEFSEQFEGVTGHYPLKQGF